MPAKITDLNLPKYMTPIRKNGRVAGYQYRRRVPKQLHGSLVLRRGKDVTKWDYYLGADLTKALARCANYTAEHDRLIEIASDPELSRRFLEDRVWTVAAQLAASKSPKAPDWRDAEELMNAAATMSAEMEQQTLALHAATIFGERGYLANLPNQSPFIAVLSAAETPPAPKGPIERQMYDATKAALVSRLTQLEVNLPTDPASRITARLEQYMKHKSVGVSTARAYRGRIRRLVDHLGDDRPLHLLDATTLRAYRDVLLEEVSRSAVQQYFSPIKAMFRWAVQEDLVDSDPTTKVAIPKNDRTIEESRWEAFDATQIQAVWKAVSEEWGPNSTGRLSAERRATFLMAFRVLLWTGMRPAEVFWLTPEQVTADIIDIKRTKTASPRVLPLPRAIEDFPDVIRSEAWTKAMKREDGRGGDKADLQKTMSESFTLLIRRAGLTNDRHVLHSTKDTLVAALDALGASANMQRSIIGHKTGQGKLRHYKTAAPVEEMREYLDRVAYCPGLPADCLATQANGQ